MDKALPKRNQEFGMEREVSSDCSTMLGLLVPTKMSRLFHMCSHRLLVSCILPICGNF